MDAVSASRFPCSARTRSLTRAPASSITSMALSGRDRKSTRLNSSHGYISYAVFCLKKKKKIHLRRCPRDHKSTLDAQINLARQHDTTLRLRHLQDRFTDCTHIPNHFSYSLTRRRDQ